MRVAFDDRLLGTLAPAAKAKLEVGIEAGGERQLAIDDFASGHRAGKGIRVVKRGRAAGASASRSAIEARGLIPAEQGPC